MWTPLDIPASPEQPFTDFSRWRLRDSNDGRHVWDFLKTDVEVEARPPTNTDEYWLGRPLVSLYSSHLSISLAGTSTEQNLPPLSKAKSPLDAARNGYTFYQKIQSSGGHWPGEYGGPMFLLPGLVIGSYVSGMSFLKEERLEMIRYLFNHVHPDDGGWGLYVFLPKVD